MAFRTLTQENRLPAGSRVLIWGRPNTWKTSSIIRTAERPIQIISLPGEKGYETIPTEEGLTSHIWQVDDLMLVSPTSVLKEVDLITAEVLSGKHGRYRTVAVEGIHKYYDFCYDDALNGLLSADMKGTSAEDMRGRAYGIAHKKCMAYLNKLSAAVSHEGFVVATCWEAERKDNPKDRSKNAPTSPGPALPGQLADSITGEYGASIRATLKRTPDGKVQGIWQILPTPSVGRCSVKVDERIARQLPGTIPQDLRLLKGLLSGMSVEEAKAMYTEIKEREEA